ncbi:glycosyltransferase family 4 protein [Marinicella gelatinilytica]|uniref:glycosyltransferase family 4 protein n=1 Tax=Marinicella gelatinilytica TaxID=2996017 RepID=UPI002260DBED|nr:glycosyltransferase family 1 protein [Marinicella gelatinilytica]MCX7544477.1 glycosyltransferase family 1 protein [Marinicella gelatinilytica]
MDKKTNILVDGFNLSLKKGSGIKTYGMTLLDAYQQLGYEVSVLTDNQFVTGENALLDEVNLFDQDEVRTHPFLNHKWLRNLRAGSYLLRSRTAHRVVPQFVEPDPDNYLSKVGGDKYAFIENIPDVFQLANRMFALTKRLTKINPAQRPGVFHLTTPWPVKIPGVKTVITIHDLIPLKIPFTTLDYKKYFYYLFKQAAESADLILAVSEHTKKDIIDIYGVPEDKIKVTYQSYRQSAPDIQQQDEAVYLQSHKLEPQKYILFVGNIEPKKNLKKLIQAMAYVKKGYKLAVVGRKAWMHEGQLKGLKNYLKKDEYVFLDYVAEYELGMLYKNATCLVMPSLYEGFGLPVLEAMQYDCPVICSDRSSLPEVAGDAAVYINPYQFSEIRDAINALIDDSEKRQEMIEKGRERVAFFSPENYAQRIAQAYEGLV